MMEALRKTNEHLADFLERKSRVPIVQIDEQQLIIDCNNGFLKLFALHQKPLEAPLADFLIAEADTLFFEQGIQQFLCNPQKGGHGVLAAYCLPGDQGMLLWCERPLSTDNQVVEQMALLNNQYISVERELAKQNYHLKQAKNALAEQVDQLESTLLYVKRLEGILPVCIYCKKIRDDSATEPGKGQWMPMEAFLHHKSGTTVSHGCCPECFSVHEED